MVKKYFVQKATKAGDPFKTQHGSELQSWFLNVEGITDAVIICNRKVDSPQLNGWVWAEAEEGTTKTGKKKITLKIKPAPDEADQAQASGVQPVLQPVSTGVTWGEALIAASNIVKDDDTLGLFEIANTLFTSTPTPLKPVEVEDDIIPSTEEVFDGPLNLDDIPF